MYELADKNEEDIREGLGMLAQLKAQMGDDGSQALLDRVEAKLRSMDDQDVEDSYAYQNFYVSRVLHRKHFYIRWAMVVTVLGVLMAVVDYWWL